MIPLLLGARRQPRKRALLIGVGGAQGRDINGCDTGGASLAPGALNSHLDVKLIKTILIEWYGYAEKDVVVMMDSSKVAEKLQPTMKNILHQTRRLVGKAHSGDNLVFFFAGHGVQHYSDSDSEIDGMDEYIVTADGKQIRDNRLRKILVDGLPAGAQLMALFDSCHGGTMLDLPHHARRREWDIELTFFVVTRVHRFVASVRARAHKGKAGCKVAVRIQLDAECTTSGRSRPKAVWQRYKRCKPLAKFKRPCGRVISLSSTADHQISLENANGGPLAQALLKTISCTQQLTFDSLLSSLQRHFTEERLTRLAKVAALKEVYEALTETYDTLSQMEKAQYKCLANNLAHHKDAGALQRPQLWSNRHLVLDERFAL